MCGVFGAVLPGGEPTDAAAIATLGLFALQHRGQESAGPGGQRRRAADALQGPRDDQHRPRRAAPAEPPRAAWRSPTAATRRPARRSGRTPSRRTAAARGGRIAIGHNGNLVNTRELLAQLEGGRVAPAGLDRHRAPDRAARRRARRRHGRGARPGPAARPRRVQPRHPRRAPGHRRPRPARLPAARPGPAAGRAAAPGGPPTAACGADDEAAAGWCLSSETAGLDIVGAEFVRDVEPGRDRHPRAGPARRGPSATPRRTRRCASSSSSTSPGRTRTWRAATSTRRAAGWASSSPSSTRSTPTSSCPSRHGRAGRGRLSPRRAACRIARGCTATATPGGRSSSRRRACATGA